MDDFFRSSPRSSNSRFSGFDIPDIFSQMFGGQQNNRQARDRQEQRETYRGSDITSGIDMDFSDAELGCKLEFDHKGSGPARNAMAPPSAQPDPVPVAMAGA